jgi:predicted nucleic-acid-binding Zn-ribbon protein
MPEHECPKCRGRMEQGFIVDNSYGALIVSHWAPGAPRKSFWTGTKVHQEKQIPIGTFRCAACGYLEHYAKPEYEAS